MTRPDCVPGGPPSCTVHGDERAGAVLLLPSLGADRTMWQPQVDELASDHRVIVVEHRGHGRAPTRPGTPTIGDLAAEVLAAADAMRIDQFDLVGISLGGITALWLAAHRPDRVRSLIVANTAARIGTADGWHHRIAAIRDGGLAAICDDVMERFLSTRFRHERQDVVEALRTAFLRVDPDGYVACCRALAHGDVTADLHRIVAPTLVIGATADVATPADQSRELHEAIPGSQLALLVGAGHLSNLEQPNAFTGLIRDHLGVNSNRRS